VKEIRRNKSSGDGRTRVQEMDEQEFRDQCQADLRESKNAVFGFSRGMRKFFQVRNGAV
jgi:hypothetical protein